MIFFTFVILILLLIMALVWLSWKLYPVLQNHGGVKALFHLEPIEEIKAEEAKPKEGEGEAKKEEKKSDTGLVDKDIDET